jgi:hypothetical protein
MGRAVMRISALAPLAILLLLLGACTGEDAGGPGGDGLGGKTDEWAPPGGATIVFSGDWSETVTGTLRAGGALRIRYDADRLPECRGEMGGRPQWAISASASVDGADADVVSLAAGDDGLLEGTLDALPDGEDLAIWFTVTNRWGCVGYDSDYGNDYHFSLGAAPEGDVVVLEFDASWESRLSAPIHAGDELHVSYDMARLPDCRGTMYGRPAWSITGWYAVDGGTARPFEVSRVEGDQRIPQEAVIEVPDGDELAFWFEITNRWGCHGYDSNLGGNWIFPITSR